MKSIYALLIFLLLVSCAKKTEDLVSPDPPAQLNQTSESQRHTIDANQSDPEFTAPDTAVTTAEAVTELTVTDTAALKPEMAPEPVIPAEEPVVEEPAAEEEPVEVSVENITVTPEIPKPEIVFADSTFEDYMIKRGDYLSKIAKNEYGDWLMWKKIYEWNLTEIGSNPNLIYPYHFLDLLKPAGEARNCPVEFYDYTVLAGETLWSIAGKIFKDELAWTILYMDNSDMIDGEDGVLSPGMVIKLRKKLDPCS